jgi:L-rhamnose isomerase
LTTYDATIQQASASKSRLLRFNAHAALDKLMATINEVAEWMVAAVNSSRSLFQADAAQQIKDHIWGRIHLFQCEL